MSSPSENLATSNDRCDIRGETFCFASTSAFDIRISTYLGADFNQYVFYRLMVDDSADELIGSIFEGHHPDIESYKDFELRREIIGGEVVNSYTVIIDNDIHWVIFRDQNNLGVTNLDKLRIISSGTNPVYKQMLIDTLHLCAAALDGSQLC